MIVIRRTILIQIIIMAIKSTATEIKYKYIYIYIYIFINEDIYIYIYLYIYIQVFQQVMIRGQKEYISIQYKEEKQKASYIVKQKKG